MDAPDALFLLLIVPLIPFSVPDVPCWKASVNTLRCLHRQPITASLGLLRRLPLLATEHDGKFNLS
jgi:hypothetical protein